MNIIVHEFFPQTILILADTLHTFYRSDESNERAFAFSSTNRISLLIMDAMHVWKVRYLTKFYLLFHSNMLETVANNYYLHGAIINCMKLFSCRCCSSYSPFSACLVRYITQAYTPTCTHTISSFVASIYFITFTGIVFPMARKMFLPQIRSIFGVLVLSKVDACSRIQQTVID